jgi:hypothetical protein
MKSKSKGKRQKSKVWRERVVCALRRIGAAQENRLRADVWDETLLPFDF